MSKDFVKIGEILKPIGTSGELKLDIDDVFVKDCMQNKHFFVKQNGNFVPYFIEYFRESAHLLVKIEEINDPQSASMLTLKPIFLRPKDLTSDQSQSHQQKESLVGYTIHDKKNVVGPIISLDFNKTQFIAWVEYRGKTIAIPIVDEWIIKLNEKKQLLEMDLPDGLLDIN